jgi:hypothetical protein
VGGKWIMLKSQSYTFTSSSSGGGSIAIGGGTSVQEKVAFVRMFSTTVPRNYRIPVVADVGDLFEFKFDGNPLDYSSHGGTASVSGVYNSTPSLSTVARIRVNPTSWSDWTSIRAGFPVQLDGSYSYSQLDSSPAVSYSWSMDSGPSTLIWDSTSTSSPTVQGAIFGSYVFRLTVTDVNNNSASTTLQVGAVATDSNGVVVSDNPVVDQIFGPMVKFGSNPWSAQDMYALQSTTQRLSDYQSIYGLSTTWPYAPWESNLSGAVSYTWNGVGMYPGISATGTTISSNIPASGLAFTISLADPSLIKVDDLPTRVYVWTASGQYEEIRIGSVDAFGHLVPISRGVVDSTNGRIASQAWSNGAHIGQFKVKGTNTSFLSTICNGTTNRQPVLHYTRTTDGSDAMQDWTNWFGCESDTTLYLYPSYDVTSLNGQPQTAKNYSYIDNPDLYVNQSQSGGLNFYGEDLAHRALYLRSGYAPALTAANMIGDIWARMPKLSGHSIGEPLFQGGLAVGGFADAMLSTTANNIKMSDLRGYASQGAALLSQPCYSFDSRDTGYQFSWLALAALYDDNTGAQTPPNGFASWRAYWLSFLSGPSGLYAHEAACSHGDNSWASGAYFNSGGPAITVSNNSNIGTGSGIPSDTCAGIASGSGVISGGNVLTGTGFVSGIRIAVTGSKNGNPWTQWYYYTLDSSTQVHFNQGATWGGDSNSVTWMIDNTHWSTVFGVDGSSASLARSWSCIWNNSGQITLMRNWSNSWDGVSGVYHAWYGSSANVAGIAVQPYMLGIRQNAWRWAALAATAAGNPTLAAQFNSLRTAASTWFRNTGFDSAITQGSFYSRVDELCEPITPASMGYGGGGPCFDDNPSNSEYDKVAMRQLTAEGSASLLSYSDSGASDAVAFGDLAYGSLWGVSGMTTGVYVPADGANIADTANSNTNWSYGKWTGFFFGMGMTHQWPAVRLGGVQPAIPTITSVPVTLQGGAVRAQVTITAPSGAAASPIYCVSTCNVTTDAREGNHWAHIVYQDSGGSTVSIVDNLLGVGSISVPLTISTVTLPNGSIGTPYLQYLVANGGTTPYTWSIVAGSLPSGFSLSSGGAISGTPTVAGLSSFTARVSDGASNATTQNLSIGINGQSTTYSGKVTISGKVKH